MKHQIDAAKKGRNGKRVGREGASMDNKLPVSQVAFRYLARVATIAGTTPDVVASVLVARGVVRDIKLLPAAMQKSILARKAMA